MRRTIFPKGGCRPFPWIGAGDDGSSPAGPVLGKAIDLKQLRLPQLADARCASAHND